MSKNKHRGGDFRDFLKDEGILAEVETRAMKQAMSRQLNRLLEKQSVTKTEMAARMKTAGRRWIGCWMRATLRSP